jgi:trigger factor
VQDSVQKLMADKKLRPAMQPEVELDERYETGKDAEVHVRLETARCKAGAEDRPEVERFNAVVMAVDAAKPLARPETDRKTPQRQRPAKATRL